MKNLLSILFLIIIFIITPLVLQHGIASLDIFEISDNAYYVPAGYNEKVNLLIEKKLIFLDKVKCEQDNPEYEIKLAEYNGDLDALFEDIPYLNNYNDLEKWYNNSYLKSDIEKYNQGEAFFIVRGCELKYIEPNLHKDPFTYTGVEKWKGSLSYAHHQQEMILFSKKQAIAIRSPLAHEKYKQATYSLQGKNENLDTHIHRLSFAFEDVPEVFLYYIGDALILENKIFDDNRRKLKLNGFILKTNTKKQVKVGDFIEFRQGDFSKSFVIFHGKDDSLISYIAKNNNRIKRQYLHKGLSWEISPQGQFLDYFTLVSRAINNSVTTHSKAFDVQLTIDQAKQNDLDILFAEKVKAKIKKKIENSKITREFLQEYGFRVTAGVTIMDGKTGDILALSSYPNKEDLAKNLTNREYRRYLTNQNFVRHPVGSTTKPFIYTAILSAYPNQKLSTFTIENFKHDQPRKKAFGCNIPYKDHIVNAGDSIDLKEGLGSSSNDFAIHFAMTAIGAEKYFYRDNSSIISVNDKKIKPDFSQYLNDNCTIKNVEEFKNLPLFEKFKELTGVALYSTDQEEEYDLKVWQPLFSYLIKNKVKKHFIKYFIGLSPAKTILNLDKADIYIRGSYINFVLGGGDHAQWTNIQLAEALSRLVTGKQIHARLIKNIYEQDKRILQNKALEDLTIPSQYRYDVLHGLQQVILSKDYGTARSLSNELAALEKKYSEYHVLAFSKTGTPTIQQGVMKKFLDKDGKVFEKQVIEKANAGVYILSLVFIPKTLSPQPSFSAISHAQSHVITIVVHLMLPDITSRDAVDITGSILEHIDL